MSFLLQLGSSAKRATTGLCRSVYNMARFGRRAPKYNQVMWVDPGAIQYHLAEHISRRESGRVLSGEWDRQRVPLSYNIKVAATKRRYNEGCTWEETGIYEHMEALIASRGGPVDGCLTWEDIEARYARLDRIYEDIRLKGFKPSSEARRKLTLRLHDEVYVHFARDGTILFGGGGCHRLAIAQVLTIPRIPVLVGRTHPDLIAEGKSIKDAV